LSHFVIKPMATAPKPKKDEQFKLLVVDEWVDSGIRCNGWRLVYWLEAFEDMPAGWYGQNCGDLCNPIGWILSTNELPAIEA